MRAVLMFHGVDSSGSVLSIDERDLARLVEAIQRSGHRVVPLRDLLTHAAGEAAVAITFDDGFVSVAERAAPVLRALGAPATLFLTTGRVGLDNAWPTQPADAPRFQCMSWQAVEALHAAGWAIEAHSVTHPDLRQVSDGALDEELERPLDDIERRLGTRPRILAYPYGYYDRRVAHRASKLYDFALTTEFRVLPSRLHPHAVPRLDGYYLRQPAIARRFGSSPLFRGYLELRGLLRRARRHPGELGVIDP
jgi:peptidoglycan/xylan/chitin deacetylase (PgdA/CDA1 family)